jgi:hypothetical protein
VVLHNAMNIPKISHMQFRVLSLMADKTQLSGAELRARLERNGHPLTGAGFYQHMARMEQADLVNGEAKQKTVYKQPVRERWYSVTATGRKVANEAIAFYAKGAK